MVDKKIHKDTEYRLAVEAILEAAWEVKEYLSDADGRPIVDVGVKRYQRAMERFEEALEGAVLAVIKKNWGPWWKRAFPWIFGGKHGE